MQRLQSFKANLLACSKTVLAIESPIFLQFFKNWFGTSLLWILALLDELSCH
jgi:hypothetical protein